MFVKYMFYSIWPTQIIFLYTISSLVYPFNTCFKWQWPHSTVWWQPLWCLSCLRFVTCFRDVAIYKIAALRYSFHRKLYGNKLNYCSETINCSFWRLLSRYNSILQVCSRVCNDCSDNLDLFDHVYFGRENEEVLIADRIKHFSL